MPRVVVVGGGFAGLRAAVTLADAGIAITLVESRSTLGGRARSFLDPTTGEVVDNGQHLFLAAYTETISFLRRLDTHRKLAFQKNLEVSFIEPGGRESRLRCLPLPAPWHLFAGILGFTALSLQDKLAMWRVARSLSDTESNGETVEEWLTRMGQSPRSRRIFWHPLAIAALNELPSRASALGLRQVIRTLLFSHPSHARLGIPSVGLSDLYAEAARRVLEEKGARILLNSPVFELQVNDDRAAGVRLANGRSLEADAVVSSLSPSALVRILPQPVLSARPTLHALRQFAHSPIVSVNLWLDRPVTESVFVGLIGTRFQWLFNKPAILRQVNYISLILSAAHDFIGQSNETLTAIAMEDLRSCFPKAKSAALIRSQVVREGEATISLTPAAEKLRLGTIAPVASLFLAGDWTATGLPATIESAVVSGRSAAEEVLKELA